MAVNDQDAVSTLGAAMAAAGLKSTGQTDNTGFGASAAPAPAQKWSYHSNRETGLTGGNCSDYFRTLYEALKEIFEKEATPGTKFALLQISREQYQALRFSAFVVAVQKDMYPGIVTYHPVIVEATGERLAARIKRIGADEIIRVVPTTDAYDNKLRGIVKERLRSHFPNISEERMIQTPVEYIPTTFDIKSPEGIRRLAMSYSLACVSKLAQVASMNSQRNIAHLDASDNLIIKPAFYANNVIKDIYDGPLRANVLVTLQSQEQVVQDNSRREQEINDLDKVVTVAEVAGFVEAIDAGVRDVSGMGWDAVTQGVQTRRQRANYVITDMVVAGNYSVSEIWLAILSAVSSLVTGNNWMAAFQPNLTSKNKLDLRDVGALNYVCNIFNDATPDALPTKDEGQFGNSDLYDFIVKTFYEGLYVSLDCVGGAANSWIFSIFRAAAFGDGPAKETLYNSLNALLDGKLSAKFPYGGEMFLAKQPIFNGSYLDADNNRAPLSDWDQIAIYNRFGKSDINYCRDWIATFTNEQAELAQRMSARYQMQEHVTGGTANITHLGERIFLSPKLLEAALLTMREVAGGRFTIDTQQNQIQGQSNKAIATFAQGAGLGSNVSFISGTTNSNVVYPQYTTSSTAW